MAARASPLEMLTTRPPSRSRVRPSWVTKNGALALTAKNRSYASSVTSPNGTGQPIPALFTRMSTPSACWSKASQRAAASPGTPSSWPTVNAEPPAASMAATVSLAAVSFVP